MINRQKLTASKANKRGSDTSGQRKQKGSAENTRVYSNSRERANLTNLNQSSNSKQT